MVSLSVFWFAVNTEQIVKGHKLSVTGQLGHNTNHFSVNPFSRQHSLKRHSVAKALVKEVTGFFGVFSLGRIRVWVHARFISY
jgi:hypothetical protein